MKFSSCLNWKVIIGVLGLGIIAYFFWPATVARFAPFLVLLICPLSMIIMARSMACHQKSDDHVEKKDSTINVTSPKEKG